MARLGAVKEVIRSPVGSAVSKPLVNIPVTRRGNSHAQVVRELGTGMVLGRYREGELLPGEPELIRQFGFSRTVLREGIKTLAAKGMVQSKTRVGTRVRERADWNMFDSEVLRWFLEGGVDQRFLRDLADIRLAVEPAAAELAAQRRRPEHLDVLEAHLEEMRACKLINAGFAEADLAFHLAIADASGNPFMRSIGAVIEATLLVSFRLSSPTDEGEHARSCLAHSEIIAAIRQQQPGVARAATEAVIRQGLKRHGALDGLE
jgi:DNA-binding FadR family transcriptional regulator